MPLDKCRFLSMQIRKINRVISVPIVTLKDTEQNVYSWQDDGLWISAPDNYIEAGLRQDFNDYESVWDKY